MPFLRRVSVAVLLVGVASGIPSTASAQVPLAVESYSMLNGMVGSSTYYDDTYNGNGSPGTELSALSGGTGDLTDGVIATLNWNQNSTPYVGWQNRNEPITFFFDGSHIVDSIMVYFDVSGLGGVAAPLGFDVDWGFGNQSFTVPPPVGNDPSSILLQLDPGTFINELTLTPQRGNEWTMLSEVEFFTTVPSPATGGLLTLGGLLTAGRSRRPS